MSSSVSLAKSQGEIKRLKFVILGETSVGKSSILTKYVENIFFDAMPTTIGASLQTPTMKIDNKLYNLEIWDTAGQERFHSLIPMYYRGAQAAVIVYDITSMQSFEKAQKLVAELKNKANPDVVIALVGNKIDLESKRNVPNREAKNYAEENDLLFMELSAKTGFNINEVFLKIVRMAIKRENHTVTIQEAPIEIENTKKKNCCNNCWLIRCILFFK